MEIVTASVPIRMGSNLSLTDSTIGNRRSFPAQPVVQNAFNILKPFKTNVTVYQGTQQTRLSTNTQITNLTWSCCLNDTSLKNMHTCILLRYTEVKVLSSAFEFLSNAEKMCFIYINRQKKKWWPRHYKSHNNSEKHIYVSKRLKEWETLTLSLNSSWGRTESKRWLSILYNSRIKSNTCSDRSLIDVFPSIRTWLKNWEVKQSVHQ